jgi:hypothetical protein
MKYIQSAATNRRLGMTQAAKQDSLNEHDAEKTQEVTQVPLNEYNAEMDIGGDAIVPTTPRWQGQEARAG